MSVVGNTLNHTPSEKRVREALVSALARHDNGANVQTTIEELLLVLDEEVRFAILTTAKVFRPSDPNKNGYR